MEVDRVKSKYRNIMFRSLFTYRQQKSNNVIRLEKINKYSSHVFDE